MGLGDFFPGTSTAGTTNIRLKWSNNDRSLVGGGWCLAWAQSRKEPAER